MKERKKILPQMFDVRPVDATGDLDVARIEKMKKIVTLPKNTNDAEDKIRKELKEELRKKIKEELRDEIDSQRENNPSRLAEAITHRREVGWDNIGSVEYSHKDNGAEENFRASSPSDKKELLKKSSPEKPRRKIGGSFSSSISEKPKKKSSREKKKRAIFFLKLGASLAMVAFICNFIIRGLEIKKNGVAEASAAMTEILGAKDSIKSGDFEKAYGQFNSAHEKLNQVSSQFSGMGFFLVEATKYVPYLSKVSSGSHLIAAGDDLSQIGIIVSNMLKNMDALKAGGSQGSSISYLSLFHNNEDNINRIATLLASAQNDLDSVNLDDVPAADRSQFIAMKQALPEVNNTAAVFIGEEQIFNDILGGNGPRKYLFLFQNNQEIRATGGFIGSYGLLDIFQGRVRNFFIDGIFNPDGQLHALIVPPVPIQKISANWSLHDSNWFPNFPTSAEKAAWFYEKDGGPTVDGVITMTPTVMQKLLAVTGPIDMPDYGITVDQNNFVQSVQYQVEVDYDKQLNKPKKILGDLAPKILDKILNMKSFPEMSKALNVLVESLNEKQILIYSRNPAVESVLSANGWSGEILRTPKDYVSVINTNINGFKTDGVVSENITHKAEIQPDGSIIDTLTIVRHHNGGDTPYEWWNQVNDDYMRVYVPAGSKLLSAEGQTREVDVPPLNYAALGYAHDPQVQAEEDSTKVDPASGTKIYTDSGKTVFANWVYVSPKETVTVKYSYLLPFKINIDALHPTDAYSLLAQKQSGSLGSGLTCEVDYPSSYKVLWQDPTYGESGVSYADNLPNGETGIKIETDLKTDKFAGIDFTQ